MDVKNAQSKRKWKFNCRSHGFDVFILVKDKKQMISPKDFMFENVKNDVMLGIKSKCRIISEL